MGFRWLTALRRNHALEHATAAMLIPRMKPGARLLGRAASRGFYIYADAPTETVSQAAREGLVRLKGGERHLAVSPLCGTNLVTAAVLAGLTWAVLTRGRSRGVGLTTTIMASMAAILVAQPLGKQAQRHLTTSTDVGGMEIAEVSTRRWGRYLRHEIRTLQGPPRSSG